MKFHEVVFYLFVNAWWGVLFALAASLNADRGRYDVLPTPRGTVVLDHSTGAAYQHPALPMFSEAR